MDKKILVLLVCLSMISMTCALQTVYNPFTGKLDYIGNLNDSVWCMANGTNCQSVNPFNQVLNTTSNVTFNNVTANYFTGNVSWLQIVDFPVACPSNYFISWLNGSVTCSTYQTDWTNVFFTNSTTNNITVNNINFTGYETCVEIAGPCDLTINHSSCCNSTGTYEIG